MSETVEIVKPIAMSPGFFYITEFSATGGVSYGRVGKGWSKEHEDKSLTAQFTTRKEVDHVGLLKWSRKVVNLAYGVMERYCSNTPIGYWVSEETAPKMLSELAGVKFEADQLNKAARDLGSRRRCRIDAYAIRSNEQSEEQIAIRLAQTIRERLDGLREDLRNGDLNAYSTSWKQAKNLPRLATGIQSESIVLALEAAKESRAALAEALRNGTEQKAAGAALNLDAIESAIWLFTDSVNGTLARVEDPEAER